MPRPDRFTPGEEPVPRRLSGPQGRSGRMQKISPSPPAFDPRTVQPIASRYTDWTVPAHVHIEYLPEFERIKKISKM